MENFNLRDVILKEHSKSQCDLVVAWVAGDSKRFDLLLNLFLYDTDKKVKQRAGWPLGYCVGANPGLIKKRMGELIKNMEQPGLHDAIKRNTVRILQEADIPKKYQGAVMNLCFHLVESPTETVAVKVFSLTVLARLSTLYPEIIPEIKLLIETQWPHQTAGFKSRARHVLQSFRC